MTVSAIFPLRGAGLIRKYPFTGGAEAQRGATEADGTEGADALEGLDDEVVIRNSEVFPGGRAAS